MYLYVIVSIEILLPERTLLSMNRLIAIWLVLQALLNCSSLHAAQFSIKSVIVVAGNFSLNGELSNIAQYDLETNRYCNIQCISV